MATQKKGNSESIEVVSISTMKVDFCILGKTPIILNKMANKVMEELLFPKGRKTSAEKANSLKHDPYVEFRNSAYILEDPKQPTLLAHLATAFKKSIAGVASDIPGSSKAQIGRLLWVDGEKIPIYGIPKLFMSVTRSADINKTPDIRTRVIVPEWATYLTVEFPIPLLNEKTIAQLLSAGGIMQGVGDWRPQKGSGNYGQYEIVAPTDKRFKDIISKGGRDVQKKALDNPIPYDNDSKELLEWFFKEAEERGVKVTRK